VRIVLCVLGVACLDLVVQEFQAWPVRPQSLPEGEQADPDPVDRRLVAEFQLVHDRGGHLFGGQRARAETLNPVTVDVQADTPQLRQQLIVAEGVGRGAQRPAGVLELATDILLGVRLFLADPVDGDPRNLHAFLRDVQCDPACGGRLMSARRASPPAAG